MNVMVNWDACVAGSVCIENAALFDLLEPTYTPIPGDMWKFSYTLECDNLAHIFTYLTAIKTLQAMCRLAC